MTDIPKSLSQAYKKFNTDGVKIKQPQEKRAGIAEQAVNDAIWKRKERKQTWQNDGDLESWHCRQQWQNAEPSWVDKRF